MSTKTTFKRVALGTVAAMGFGLLSVVPASADPTATTATYTNLTSPTTNPVVGSAVILPVSMAVSGTQAAAATSTLTATLSVRPTNSALTAQSTALSIDTYAAAHTAGGNTGSAAAAVAGTTGARLSIALANANQDTTGEVGRFSFIPDTAGYYEVTLTTGGTATQALTNLIVGVTVRGGSLVQAASGLGTALGTQVTGRQAAAAFFLPAGTATTNRFRITATGTSIVGVFNSTSLQDAVDASTYTGTTGILRNNGTTFADGVTVTPQRAVTVPTGVATTRANGNTNDGIIVQFTSATAGAATVTIQDMNVTTGVLTTVGSVTVDFGAVATVSPTRSTANMGQGSTRPSTPETAAIRIPSTAGVALSGATTGATIAVEVKDATGADLVNQAITATITGAGLITLANDAAGNGTGSTGLVRTASLTATTMASSSKAIIGVSADGTRGVGTITITAGGVTIATKTVTFYGAVATLTATQGVAIMASGRTATSDEATFRLGNTVAASNAGLTATTAVNLRIVAADVDGNVVPLAGSAISADISDTAVIDLVTITDCAGTALTANSLPTICAVGAGNFVASTRSAIGGVSGAKATVTFQTPNPAVAGTFIKSAAIPFSLGGTRTGGTVTMTLDKATYEPGERMVITYTAKDAAGNPVADWTPTGAPVANKAATVNATNFYVNGSYIFGDSATELAYAPVAPGAFTLTLTSGTSTTATITATATVADDAATTAAAAAGDAAAEATDAANAATDAANAAAEAADAATAAAQDAADAVAALSASVATMVSDLKKQITSLTNLVIKIQKKVRA
jgi:trimeric autotransporter adhesin